MRGETRFKLQLFTHKEKALLGSPIEYETRRIEEVLRGQV
jgi:hypothetical protein